MASWEGGCPWDNLVARGWIGPSVCCLCGKAEETLVRIFVDCDFARAIWGAIDSHILFIRVFITLYLWDEALYCDR